MEVIISGYINLFAKETGLKGLCGFDSPPLPLVCKTKFCNESTT